MMKNLPIGISEFAELRRENCVYVDKTRHVYTLLTKERRSFLSRPRRFGKSLLVSTLEAALQGKKELFEDLWIAHSDYMFVQIGVMRLDFSILDRQSIEKWTISLIYMLCEIAENIRSSYPQRCERLRVLPLYFLI